MPPSSTEISQRSNDNRRSNSSGNTNGNSHNEIVAPPPLHGFLGSGGSSGILIQTGNPAVAVYPLEKNRHNEETIMVDQPLSSHNEEKKDDNDNITALSMARISKNRYLRAVQYANKHNSRFQQGLAAGKGNGSTTATATTTTSKEHNSNGTESLPNGNAATASGIQDNTATASPSIMTTSMRSHVPTTRPLKPPAYVQPLNEAPVPRLNTRTSLGNEQQQQQPQNEQQQPPPPLKQPAQPPQKTPPQTPPKIPQKHPQQQQQQQQQQHPTPPLPLPRRSSTGESSLPPRRSSSGASVGRMRRSSSGTSALPPRSSSSLSVRSISENNIMAASPNPDTAGSSPMSALARLSVEAMEWRKHGKLFRARLVLNDEDEGGNAFQVSKHCSIERYYKVAERVLEQFLSTSIRRNARTEELAESYLVGNRLVKFLSMVLPTHPEYFSSDPKLFALRKRSQGQLVELLQYLENIALVIDEIQYNQYLIRGLSPEEENLLRNLTGGKGPAETNTTNKLNRSTASLPPLTPLPPPPRLPGEKATIIPSSAAQGPKGVPPPPPPPPPPMAPPPRLPPPARQDCTALPDPPPNSTVITDMPQPQTNRNGIAETLSDCVVSNPSNLSEDSSVRSLSDSGTDELQERVAQVVRMTEAFSDALENTGDDGRPGSNFCLKQTLLASAKSVKLRHRKSGRRLAGSVTSSSASTYSIQNEEYPDPPLETAPSLPSKVHPQRGNRTPAVSNKQPTIRKSTVAHSKKSQGAQSSESLCDSDSFDDEWAFEEYEQSTVWTGAPVGTRTTSGAANASTHPSSHIDLLEIASERELPSLREEKTFPNKAQSAPIPQRESLSTHIVPKIKQPPSHPSRAAVARAAASLQFDELFLKSQMVARTDRSFQSRQGHRPLATYRREDQKSLSNRNEARGDAEGKALLPSKSGLGLKTKIEERLERAAAHRAKESQALDPKRPVDATKWQGDAIVNPNNPFNDDFDDNNSIAADDEEGNDPGRQLSSNRKLLRHFKECLNCLLD